MRIVNNLMALNTHRQLGINNEAGAKSVEKLSSGYRINRAGDDAAGLAISEKMRSQIRGLTQASRNAQDDISLIQTTEGALNETHAIIHRMREMAVQSANDSNTDADRESLQNEMNQLAQEVTRIANTTEFNTRKLLNGNLDANTPNAVGDLTFHIGANTDQNMKFSVKAMDAFTLGLAVNGGTINDGRPDFAAIEVAQETDQRGKYVVDGQEISITYKETEAPTAPKRATNTAGAEFSAKKMEGVTGEKMEIVIDGKTTTITSEEMAKQFGEREDYTVAEVASFINTKVGQDVATTDGSKLVLTSVKKGVKANVSLTATGTNMKELKLDVEEKAGEAYKPGTYTITATTLDAEGQKVTGDATGVKGDSNTVKFTDDNFKGLNIVTDGLFEGLTGNITVRTSAAASFQGNGAVIDATAGVAIDITTQKAANLAIDRIDKALKMVSDQRAELGAVQNRLGHTIKNVDTAAENLQAAESRIRDVDMAKEMMEFTKNSILQQASQAMLAQANQAPQGVLQLLR